MNRGENSMPLHLLRLGLLLVLVGFFAPIACDVNGYQIAQGLLGNTHHAGNAGVLGSIGKVFGYLLFGVFLLAVAGLGSTFVRGIKYRSLGGFVCLALSLFFLTIVVFKFKTIRDTGLLHFFLAIFPVRVKILIGGYSIGLGYLAGITGFVLDLTRGKGRH
jgi:hypothetical protein